MPDWQYIRDELTGKNVTLFLLWQEYRQANPDGYQYSWFCEHYRAWRGKLDLMMRQDHRAGEKLFLDYAGQTGFTWNGWQPSAVYATLLSNRMYRKRVMGLSFRILLRAPSLVGRVFQGLKSEWTRELRYRGLHEAAQRQSLRVARTVVQPMFRFSAMQLKEN